jgi:hypothetical protein
MRRYARVSIRNESRLETRPDQGSSPSRDSVRLTFCCVMIRSITRCRTEKRRALPSIFTVQRPPKCWQNRRANYDSCWTISLTVCDLGTLCAGASETDTASRLDLTARLHDLLQTRPLFKTTSTSFLQSNERLQFKSDRDAFL